MNLYSDIYQLLKFNDCVIIPGFGGFIANYSSAKVDFNSQEFFPPSKSIAFNKSLNSNDGLLLNHISKSRNLSWEKAVEEVENFVESVNNSLKNNDVVEFPGLGCFVLNQNVLVFTPFDYNDLLEDSYGLSVFTYPMLKFERKPVFVQTKDKDKKQRKSLRPLVYTLTSAAVLAGLVTLSFHFGLFENQTKNTETAKVVSVENIIKPSITPETTEIAVLPTEEIQEDIIEEEIVENIIEEDFVKPDLTINTNTQSHSVHVIAGVFSSSENAHNLCEKYKSQGFESIILPHNNMYRVSLKSFADTKTAYAELPNLKEKADNQALWVLGE